MNQISCGWVTIVANNLPFMKEAKHLLLIFSIFSLSQVAVANNGKEGKSEGSGIVQGCISDSKNKKPVKGVTISIKAQNVQHEVTSDASGNFKLPKLPAGKVTIVLEKKGYKTYKQEGVVLKEGMVINFNIANLSESEEEVFHPLSRMMDGFR